MSRLEGRNALVTGAGRGFGRAIAAGLAREGANVAVHYGTSRDGALEAVAEVHDLRREAFAVQADLRSWDDIRRLAEEVFDRFGRLDVLVNNVGDVAPEQMSWRDVSEVLIDRVLAVDVTGTLLVTHEVGCCTLEREGGGAIVNVCSNVVVTGSPRAPP